MKYIPLFFVFFICSCSSVRNYLYPKSFAEESFVKESKANYQGYIEHLVALGQDYINSTGIHIIKLKYENEKYLKSVFEKIIKSNELVFGESEKKLKVNIINDDTPFYFSLPKGQLFFSLGLLVKYVKNEDFLVALMSAELIKSYRNVYEKRTVVPIGFMLTEQMLYLTRIPISVKQEINKWAYHCMRRAGYDGFVYLNWLQLQNKNSMDFATQHGDIQMISREEFAFKNFAIQERIETDEERIRENNSSAAFYALIGQLQQEDKRNGLRKN